MAKRIGERLVEKGLITRTQLAEALRYQLIFGGQLGTCLIELGHIGEDPLGETLAEFHRVRHAPPEVLRDIPPSVIQVLSPEIVEKHRVVPIGISGRTLNVAVVSVRELGSLSQATGYKIVPWIAPEFRVLEAMERYYRIPRRPRFLKISHRLERAAAAAAATEAPPAPAPRVETPSFSPAEEAVLHAAGQASAPSEDLGTSMEYGASWHEIADRLEAARSAAAPTDPRSSAPAAAAAVAVAPPPAPTPQPPAPSAAPVAPAPIAAPPVAKAPTTDARPREVATRAEEPAWSFEEVSFLLSHADNREDLSSIVLSYASGALAASVLFGVRGENVYVWDSRNLGPSPERTATLTLPIEGSIFELLHGDDVYRGAVPEDPACRSFYERLGRPVPAQVLLLPVHLNDRLVALLYGEGGPHGVRGESQGWVRLAHKIALTLNMIILKNRIRTP